jgi:glycosyltransferase involved in cell wall biosynthesis
VSFDFSVIIPTFRRPQQLMESIASVLRQSEARVEIFVIDDSPEGSAQTAVEALRDPRITYVKNPNPTGGVPSLVRNLGWPLANGTFVHFLDDDDIVAEGYYSSVKAEFARRADIGLVFGRIEPFGSGPAPQLDHERRYFANAAQNASACKRFGARWAFTGRMLFDQALLVSSASIVRRHCVSVVGGFDPAIRLMEDADFHVRVMREFGAAFIDRTAVYYRIGDPSLMHSPNPIVSQREDERNGHRSTQAKYRHDRGVLEFYALALFTRTVLKIL